MRTKTKLRSISFSVRFFVRKSKVLKNGDLPIQARITLNRTTAEISIQGTVKPELWNNVSEKSTGKDREAKELNYYIDSVRSKLFQIQRDTEIEGKTITAQHIKNIYLGNTEAPNEAKKKTILEVHTEHNERCRNLLGKEYAQSTIYKFDTALKYLKEFLNTKLKRKDINIEDINEDFIRNFELFLKTDKNNSNNSALKHLKILKKIILIALRNNWINRDPFVNIKFRRDEVHVEFLTMHELNLLMEKKMPCKRLEQIRDVFVFCSFTGLAFVDVKELKSEHIVHGNEGEMWIRKPRAKTNNMCNIPLLRIPRELLEKYQEDKNCQSRGQLLPVPTNQKMNAYLKEVADLCGIEKRLTTHCSRHTFATSVTLANKVTIENVAKMLGHSSTRMTQHYARVLDESILEDMINVDQKLLKRTSKTNNNGITDYSK